MSVTNGNDSGPGSLRDQILNSSETYIAIDPLVDVITLDSTIPISRNVVVSGLLTIITPSSLMTDSHLFLVQAGSVVEFDSISFDGNLASPTLAITATGSVGDGTALTLSNCVIQNWASVGAVIDARDTSVTITSCDFMRNTVSMVLHIYGTLDGTRTTTVSGSYFSDNVVTRSVMFFDGGGLFEYRMEIVLVDLTFRLNEVNGTIGTRNSVLGIESNTPGSTAAVVIQGCTISENSGSNYSCLYLENTTIESTDLSNVRITNNTGTNDDVNDVLGISLIGDVTTTSITLRFVSIYGCSIADNSGASHTGIRAISDNFNNTLTLRNTTIARNTCLLASPTAAAGLQVSGGMYNFRMENTTIYGNVSPSYGGAGFGILSGTEFSIINCTIAENIGSIAGGVINFASDANLWNTLIADNYTTAARTIRSDFVGTVATFSSNNLVSDATGSVGFDLQSNIIGTAEDPVLPLLGALGNYGGINNIEVVPLLEGSPAISAGDNGSTAGTYDARGSPFLRIWPTIEDGGSVDIGSFQLQPFASPCYLGDSLVKVKDKQGIVKHLPVKAVYANEHEVWNMETNEYIPIVHNAKIQGVEAIYFIAKDLLGANKPSQDLFITSGHPILVNDRPVKARDVPGATKIKITRSDVYSVVCDEWVPIDINGIGVYAWSKEKWLARVRQEGIVWVDNTKH